MASYANNNSGMFTQSGQWFDSGMAGLTDLGNKYKDNETISSFVGGTFGDIFRTQAMGGLSLGYNQAMSSHLANLQQGYENLRTGNTMKLMGAEGRIARDLIGAQGEQERMGIRETGIQQRMNYGVLGQQERMNIGARGVQDRLLAQTKGNEDRLLAQTQGAEQRKGLRVMGEQERLNIGKRSQEERNMRADARGAIRSLGSRFFG